MKKTKVIIILSALLLVIAVTGIAIFSILNRKPKYNATSEYDNFLCNVESVGSFTAATSEVLLKEDKNICYSPISLYAAMCLSAEYVTEESKDEIVSALKFKHMRAMEEGYEDIMLQVLSGENANVVNSLWIQKEYEAENASEKIEKAKDKIAAEVFVKDFENSEVSKWITEKTNNLINMELPNYNKMIFVNATYFQDGWEKDFTILDKKEKFKLNNGKKIEINFMQLECESSYVRGKNYTAVTVPYEMASMIFILPDDKVEDIINKETINEILASYTSTSSPAELTIKVPMFECESEFERETIFEGIENAGITSIRNVDVWTDMVNFEGSEFIDIQQKSYIKVDDKGAEAATSTSISDAVLGIFDEPEPIKLELIFGKPFMYIITKGEVPLFIGTVYNPAE